MEAMRLDTGLTFRRTGPFRIDATDKRGELEFEAQIRLLSDRKWHVVNSNRPLHRSATETIDRAVELVKQDHQAWLDTNKKLVDLLDEFDAEWIRISEEPGS